jgi:hypothetical protein
MRSVVAPIVEKQLQRRSMRRNKTQTQARKRARAAQRPTPHPRGWDWAPGELLIGVRKPAKPED